MPKSGGGMVLMEQNRGDGVSSSWNTNYEQVDQ